MVGRLQAAKLRGGKNFVEKDDTSQEPRLTPNICAAPDLTAASCVEQSVNQAKVIAIIRHNARESSGCLRQR